MQQRFGCFRDITLTVLRAVASKNAKELWMRPGPGRANLDVGGEGEGLGGADHSTHTVHMQGGGGTRDSGRCDHTRRRGTERNKLR